MTPQPGVPRHSHDVELGWDELVEALARLEGSPVAVRVVESGDPEALVVVLRGELAAARHDRAPTVFWPVEGAPPPPEEVEEPGIYVNRERFVGAVARAGGSVLVIAQGPLIVNVRRA